jgi:nicotinamidase-related amidase
MENELKFLARRGDATESIAWAPGETAVVIVDMWDKTICRSAEQRVVELAPQINEFVKSLRQKGVLVVHAPHGVMKFYEGTPQRKLAQSAPFVEPPVPIDWQEPDPAKEDEYPINDEDWCDDTPKCNIKEAEEKGDYPWTRQIASIEILPEDAVSDNGQEIYNLFEQRGIKNVLMVGVHLNRCILGRPYGIRQMVMLGKNVVLVRDLIDGLYDPRSKPFVSHKEGVELLVKHVEKFWCPSVESSEVI